MNEIDFLVIIRSKDNFAKSLKNTDEQLPTPQHDAMVLELLEMDEKQLSSLLRLNPIKGTLSIEGKWAEVPIKARNGFLIGYWDVIIDFTNTVKDNGFFGFGATEEKYSLEAFIEVKPTINSFGAVLRQINTYNDYTYHPQNYNYSFFLYTLDTKFDSAFEGQGINVIHPSPSTSIRQ